MDQFPDLRTWFNISNYYDHNQCRAISLLLRNDLQDRDIESFKREFTKLICRLRCNGLIVGGEDLSIKFQEAIDGRNALTRDEKKILSKAVFFNGIISMGQFRLSGHYRRSVDDEAFNGYFGEVLFYLIRNQILEDEKIMIEPTKPKEYSKQPGIDYTEIRRSNDRGLYFVIGEIKTTDNTIGNYPDRIINALKERTPVLFLEQVNAFKERARYQHDVTIHDFVDRIPNYYITNAPEKTFAGVINYGGGRRPYQTVFQDFRDDCIEHLYDQTSCRRIKFVGIQSIHNIKEGILDYIWNTLLI